MGETNGASRAAVTPPDQHADTVGGRDDMPTPKQRTTSPAFQLYPKDFLSSTKVQRMSLTEIGAYTVLLFHCWLSDGLPTDIGQLARIVKVPEKQFKRMWAGALSECFYTRDGRLHNERLDGERKKQHEYRRRQTDNGAKGGRPKNPRQTQNKPMGFENETQPITQPEAKKTFPSPSPEVPPNPPAGGRSGNSVLTADDAVSDAAGRFLERYPGIFAKVRSGAAYHVRSARDHPVAMDLIQTYGDVDYLCDMLELFLRKTEWKPKNVPGSPGQFRHMAPECDAELRRANWHRAPRASRVAS